MKEYIDKSVVMTEIERLKSIQLSIFSRGETEESCYEAISCISVYNQILSLLDKIEVKDEILDKEGKTNLMKKCVHEAYKRGYDMGTLQTVNKINHNMKEMDLEKEISDWWNAHYSSKAYTFEGYNGHYIENSTLLEIVKHFYEIGLKSKEE